MQSHPIHEALIPHAQPERINDFMRYFQSFEGGYAEGDTFMGVMVPDRQKVAKVYFDHWDERVLRSGLVHPIHEVRHTALFTLMRYYGKERKRRQHWHDVLYSCLEGINNWDLVDTCAHKIFGQHAFNTGDFSTLEKLLESSNVWKKRTAIVAQLWMLKQGRYDELLAYAPVAAEDAPEILQKAIGWLMKCLWQQQPELAEDHMAAYLQEGLYTRLIVRIGLEKAGKDHRNHFFSTFAPK